MTTPTPKVLPTIVHVYHCKTQSCPNDRLELIQPKGSTKTDPIAKSPLPCSFCGKPMVKPKVIERIAK